MTLAFNCIDAFCIQLMLGLEKTFFLTPTHMGFIVVFFLVGGIVFFINRA